MGWFRRIDFFIGATKKEQNAEYEALRSFRLIGDRSISRNLPAVSYHLFPSSVFPKTSCPVQILKFVTPIAHHEFQINSINVIC